MAFANATTQRDSVAQINITPLVDVLLVLLVIFMIAAPVLTQRIPLTLPGTAPPPSTQATPAIIDLRIDAAGQLTWNGSDAPMAALQPMLEAELQRDPANPPTLRIDANGDADYGVVAKVLAAARNADLTRIAFVIE
jgi:biopolymer transport protein ExbD